MALLFKSESAQRYETGFSCDHAIVAVFGSEKYFITDGRYTVEANELTNDATEVIEDRALIPSLRHLIRRYNAKNITYDPSEWSILEFETLRKKLPTQRFMKKAGFAQKRRIIKHHDEIQKLTKAVTLGAEAFEAFANWITKEGNSLPESRLFYQAQAFLTHYGERALSFDPIVALGANAAKPHALPTATPLMAEELLLFDAGVKYEGYCSDRTRTAYYDGALHFGIEQSFKDPLQQKIYDIVLKAHDEAIAKARPGMKASELDKVARDVIEDSGYGDYFVHSLGHGVGLDIHEHPFISPRSDTVLEENMVFTIEPGIYLPEKFGVRIEDMVVLQNGKAQVL